MIIGSVTELKPSEKRVGLLPLHAQKYIEHGHEVIVESGLGVASGFNDDDYRAVGAHVVSNAKEVWDKAEMIIKVKEPMPCEYDLMRENQIIYTYFHLAADQPLCEALLKQKVTALAYETIEDDNENLVLLKPMSEIAGKLAVLEGNKYLEQHYGGKGILLSGTSTVAPGRVLIVGAGSVGLAALKEAYNLGANVTALVHKKADVKPLQSFFPKVEVFVNSDEILVEQLKKADVVVSSVLIRGAKTEQIIKREYLKLMEPGSVIVDVAIDQGGSLETSRPTTHLDPIYIIDDVIHYCVANMAGSVPKTSSMALGDATLAYGLKVANLGLLEAIKQPGIYKGVNTYQGKVTNEAVAKVHHLDFEAL